MNHLGRSGMRSVLDGMYRVSAGLAAAFLVLIAVLIGSAIVGRWFGVLVPSADDIAGYCMAASAFLGLAPTLHAGGHIRVTVLLTALGPRARVVAESAAVLVGIALFGMLAFNTTRQNISAFLDSEMSTGIVPIPIWVPQCGMTLGVVMMLVALLDEFVRVATGKGGAAYADPELAAAMQQRSDAMQTAGHAKTGGR